MNTIELDQALARFHKAGQATGEQLVELDRDPLRQLLDESSLSGDSASRWTHAKTSLSAQWELFAQFREVLAQAFALRGRNKRVSADRIKRVESLLINPPIELGPAVNAGPMSLENVIAGISVAVRAARSEMAAIGDAWSRVFSRLETLESKLDRLQELTIGAGDQESAGELVSIREDLKTFYRVLRTDPLAIDDTELDEMEARADGLDAICGAAAQLRERLGDRMDIASSLAEELDQLTADVDQTYGEVTAKIVAPAIPNRRPIRQKAHQSLEVVKALAGYGEWLAANRELEEWTNSTKGLCEQLRADIAALRAPLEERNEMRGLLDAYRAMAVDRGRLDDARLAELYGAARSILYHAPTDLVEARKLLGRYQHALALEPRREVEL
jgi:hypothetical protein